MSEKIESSSSLKTCDTALKIFSRNKISWTKPMQALISSHSLFEGQVGVSVPRAFRIPTGPFIKITLIAVMYSKLTNEVFYPI